ncbi:MAG: hypothetical protein MK132_05525 [Lentisphaerales bacterium]|nr:hypothetical protein [Lentisphaerales bacterium]
MRKRLGCSDKAPIQSLEQSLTSNSFTLISCLIALIISFFAVRLGVDFINFIESNTEGDIFIAYKDEPVLIVQGIVCFLAVVFIFSRR